MTFHQIFANYLCTHMEKHLSTISRKICNISIVDTVCFDLYVLVKLFSNSLSSFLLQSTYLIVSMSPLAAAYLRQDLQFLHLPLCSSYTRFDSKLNINFAPSINFVFGLTPKRLCTSHYFLLDTQSVLQTFQLTLYYELVVIIRTIMGRHKIFS